MKYSIIDKKQKKNFSLIRPIILLSILVVLIGLIACYLVLSSPPIPIKTMERHFAEAHAYLSSISPERIERGKLYLKLFTKITEVSEIEDPWIGNEYSQIQIYRCTLNDIELIFDLLAKFKDNESNIEPQKILDDFPRTAYLILKDHKEAAGMVMWQYDNFLSVVDRLIIQPNRHNQGFVGKIIHALDSYFNRYMAEANVYHLPEYDGTAAGLLPDMGYREIQPAEITSAAWREVLSQKERHWKHIWIKEYTSTANQAGYGNL